MAKVQRENLLITPSIYTLLIYLLLNNKWEESDYVLHKRIPQLIQTNLERCGAHVYVDYRKEKGNTILGKLMENLMYWKYLNYSHDIQYKNVYGNDEFYLSMKYRNQGIKIIEDGPYYNSKELLRKRRTKLYAGLLNYWFYWIWKDYIPWGYDDHVTTYYHTSINKLSDEIAYKGVSVDISTLWQGKTEIERNKIMQIFGIEPDTMTNIRKYRKILVTELLPISDQEKIEMYKSLLKDNGINQSELLIKTHYAEKVNYRVIFPQAMVVDKPIPAQLFDVLGYEADTALTISSSAIFAFVKPNTKIIFKGTEFDDRLKKHFGIIRLDDILKQK